MAKRILVVDDEQGFRDLLTLVLKPAGFEVVCVQNGQEAVKKVEEAAYDLILMDVHMPLLAGPEALKKIQQIRPHQKVIMLSSGSDPNRLLEIESEQKGSVACVYKPLTLEELQRAIEKALGPLPRPL